MINLKRIFVAFLVLAIVFAYMPQSASIAHAEESSEGFLVTEDEYLEDYSDETLYDAVKCYRYRTKSTVKSGNPSLSGYTLDSKTTLSTSTGNWTASEQKASTTNGDSYQTVVTVEKKTAYTLRAYYTADKQKCWKYQNDGYYPKTLKMYSSVKVTNSGYKCDPNYANSYELPRTVSISSPGKMGTIYILSWDGSNVSSFTAGANLGYTYLWDLGTATVYRKTTKKIQYNYYKWNEYGAWTKEYKESTSTLQRDSEIRYFVIPVGESIEPPDNPVPEPGPEPEPDPDQGIELPADDTDPEPAKDLVYKNTAGTIVIDKEYAEEYQDSTVKATVTRKDNTYSVKVTVDGETVDFIPISVTVKVPEGIENIAVMDSENEEVDFIDNGDGTITVNSYEFTIMEAETSEEPPGDNDGEGGSVDRDEDVVELLSDVELKTTTTRPGYRKIKVNAKITNGSMNLIEIKNMGYTIKYKYFVSRKASSGYELKSTKSTKTYTYKKGKLYRKYYFKVKIFVYDDEDEIIAKTALSDCRSSNRVCR